MREALAFWGQMTMHIGKHKVKTFSEIAEIDKPYAAWVLRDSALPGSFRKFAKYLQANHGGILEVGKHKMKFFDAIVQTDPDYCEWALRLKQPSDAFKKFVEYLQDAFDDEQPAKKKSKIDNVCNVVQPRSRLSSFPAATSSLASLAASSSRLARAPYVKSMFA